MIIKGYSWLYRGSKDWKSKIRTQELNKGTKEGLHNVLTKIFKY